MNSVTKFIVIMALIGCAVAASTPRTCNATLPVGANNGGFDVCLFGATGNILTNTIGAVGNLIWTIQREARLGNCYCNQDCSPSQIVCTTPINTPFGHVNNGLAQIVYNAEDYQFYCYCPQYVSASDACPFVTQPQNCNLAN